MTTSKLLAMEAVKSSRAQKAAVTRQRMLDAAYELFCESGFRGTTMAAVAERAGVAVQTVYFTFHTKDALLQEVHDQTVLGRDPTPPFAQPWWRAAAAEPDPQRAVAHVVSGVQEILARVAPMMPVFHAVAGDAAGEVYRHAEELRRKGMQDLVSQVLLPKGDKDTTMDAEEAAALVFVLLGPELYRSFVQTQAGPPTSGSAGPRPTLNRDLFEQAKPDPA
jgi:AcrR family transcriptional regulator